MLIFTFDRLVTKDKSYLKVIKTEYFIFKKITVFQKMNFICKNRLKIFNLNKVIDFRSNFDGLAFP